MVHEHFLTNLAEKMEYIVNILLLKGSICNKKQLKGPIGSEKNFKGLIYYKHIT